jgi:hypothetical protein
LLLIINPLAAAVCRPERDRQLRTITVDGYEVLKVNNYDAEAGGISAWEETNGKPWVPAWNACKSRSQSLLKHHDNQVPLQHPCYDLCPGASCRDSTAGCSDPAVASAAAVGQLHCGVMV